MSSTYPILDNRPIDQWKVTELKEELKKRKLPIKGLKDDLIERLDEALHIEREAAEASEKDEANGFNGDVAGINDSRTVTVVAEVVDTIVRKSAETVELETSEGNAGIAEPIELENAEYIPEVVGNNNKSNKVDGVSIPVDINSSVPALDQEVKHKDFPAAVDSVNVGEELIVNTSTIKTTVTLTESVLKEVGVSSLDSYIAEPQKDSDDSVTKQENEESKVWLDNDDSKPPLECDLKSPCEDLMPNSSVPENQVFEVNPSVGSQVKSDSISSNCVSINKKNELNDTIIADNFKLEQDIVKPEMVDEPSSKNDVPVNDESHSMDVGKLPEKKGYNEENSNNNNSPDLIKTNNGEDVGYPEKLNLDRSSGDDYMEEDLPESNQFDSKFNVDDLRDKGESVEVPTVKEEVSTVVVGDGLSSEKSGTRQDDIPSVSLVEKRKFRDQASVRNNEPSKRQRRWNSETIKGSDPQRLTVRPATTPKVEPVALKRSFSRSFSSSTDDAPKERIVPPSQTPPTNSLRIDRFLRPFTLKAVQDLLGKTGNVISFWMDQIKTHCYVTYSSEEEAIDTRNAVYNLQWPPNGGRQLVAEFVNPQEVKMKHEAPPTPVAPVSADSTIPLATAASPPEPSPLQHREQPPVLATLPSPPPLSKLPPAARERLPSSPPRERLPSAPPLLEKVDQPIVTLDDLFRKTGATPRIYYLPLSEEQVAAKLAAQGNQAVGN